MIVLVKSKIMWFNSKYRSSFFRFIKTIGFVVWVALLPLVSNGQTVVTGDYTSGTAPTGWTQSSSLGYNQWGCGSSVYIVQGSSDYVQSPALTFVPGTTYSIYITASCQIPSGSGLPNVSINGTTIITNAAVNSTVNFTVGSTYTSQSLKVIPSNNNALGIQKVAITFPSTATISTTGALSAVNTCFGTASSTTSFSVSGTNLSAGISLAALSGFEYCLTIGGTYTSTLTVGAAGTVSATTVYVRLASADAAGSYSGNIVLSSSGASSVNVATIASTVNVLPASSNLSTSAVSTICAGSSASVTINSTTLTSGNYTVTYTVSGTNTVTTTTASMSFTAGSPGTGTFTTSVLNTVGASNVVNITAIAFTASGCSSTVSTSTAAFTTIALPTPTFTAQAGASTCVGTSVIYTTQSGGGQSAYSWSIPGTASTDYSITGGGTTTSSVTLQWLTAGSKTLTINYTLNGCTAASSTSSTATTVNALPTITGTLNVCVGSTTQLTGSGTAAGSTPWVSGTTSIATTTNVGLVSGVATGTSIITYTNNNGCSKTASVTVNARPSTAVLAGAATICNGNSTNLTVTITGGASPFTVIYSGGTVSSYTSASYISVSPSSTTPYSLTSVTDVNGCTAITPSGTPTITVNAVPTPTISAQPGSTVCSNTDVIYTTQASKSSYLWSNLGTLGTDYSITSGGVNSNSITLKWLTTGSKTVTINYSNGTCSAVSPTSSTATTVTSSTLSTPGTITGTATVVQGQTAVSYSISAITNATGYSWTLPSNASITSGSNTNSISVSYASNALSGNLYVSATNSCVTSSSSPTYAVTVAPLLTAAVSASVDAAFDITFIDNSAWRTAISSITINGSTLASGAYNTTVAGKITFTPSLSTLLQSSGTKSIVVIATGYSNTTVSQTINSGASTKLAVQTTPVAQSSYSAALFTTQPVVLIQDQYGNTTSSTANITATVGAGTWTLAGTATIAAVSGTATYTTLTSYCTSAVTGATLVFSSSGLTSVTCSTFNIPLMAPREMYYISAGGNWSVAANWRVGSCSGTTTTILPTSSDNVYLNCGGSSTVTLDVSGSSNNLTIANGVTLALGGNNLNVSGNLTVNNASSGSISWTSGNLTVSGNITIGNSSGSVNSGTGYLILNGTLKTFTIAKNVTIQNLRFGSSTLAIATASNTLTINGTFDMNGQTGFTHTSGFITVSGTVTNSGSMLLSYTGSPTFSYTGGGTIAPGTYYNLITSTTGATIACGTTITVNNSFTNSTLLTGSTNGWARIVSISNVSNSGTIGSSTTYLSLSCTINGGSIGGTNGVNVLQSNSMASTCTNSPIIIVSKTALTNLSYCSGSGPSVGQSYSVAGAKLSDNIIITAPTHYEISLSLGSGYTNTLTLTQSSGSVSPSIIFVRLKSGYTAASYSESVTINSTGATIKSITCSGTVFSIPVATASSSSPVYTSGVLTFTGGPNSMAQYNWTGPNSYTSSLQNASLTNPSLSAAGTYTLSVIDGNGCTNTATTVVSVTASSTYTCTSGNPGVRSNWSPIPSDFSGIGCVYIIKGTITLDSNWTVSGTGSKIVIGDSSNSTTSFTIPSNFALTTISPVVVDVKPYATLIIQNTNIPTLGHLSQYNGTTSGQCFSTVIYDGSGAQTIEAANYSNLTISGARGANNVTFANSGSIGVSYVFNPTATFTTGGYISTNSTIIFNAPNVIPSSSDPVYSYFTQNIPTGIPYYNLQTQNGHKQLAGNITVSNILSINLVSILNLNTYTLTLSGSGTPLVVNGTFTHGSGSVIYSSNSTTTITSAKYYNLDISGGSRILQSTNNIAIANLFATGSGPFTTTGSTVEFNGTSAQNIANSNAIPGLGYNNLLINNSSGTELGATATVGGTLTMQSGILTTTNLLTITNTAANAVGGGSTTCFINGPLKRMLPNTVDPSSLYSFPVGSSTTYLPFSMNTISGTATFATVQSNIQSITAGSGGVLTGTGINAINTSEYWSLAHDNVLTASVSLTRPLSLPINSSSVIAHCSTCSQGSYGGTYNSVGGNANTSTNTVQSSNSTPFSDLIIATSSAPAVIYNYSGSGDITSVSNWVLSSDGVTHPASFAIDNATYVVENTAAVSVSSNWAITGSNTTLQIGDGTNITTLTVASGISLSVSGDVVISCFGTFSIGTSSVVTDAGTLTTSSCGSTSGGTLNNSGTLNVANSIVPSSNSYLTINNNSTGIINITGNLSVSNYAMVYNYGDINITNGSFTDNGSNVGTLFHNESSGNVVINNTNDPQAAVTLQNAAVATFDYGSTFKIIGSNLNVSSNLSVSGSLIVQDGNLNFSDGGGSFAINNTGGIYLYDTNNNGDGVLNITSGSQVITDNGMLYVEGVSSTSGTNSINVNSGATIFVGNMGLLNTSTGGNKFTVSSGATLDYCGNKTSGSDSLGTIESGAVLNYANGYYGNSSPGAQGDFTVVSGASQNIAFSDYNSCVASFLTQASTANGLFSALPISLSTFDVNQNGDLVAIEWTTETETNNDFFSVMKSYDAITFDVIGDVPGAGTSTVKHYYNLNDENPQVGINYYKLKQTDFDGHFTYSTIKSLNFTSKNVDFLVYPNPSKFENITIIVNVKRTEDIQLRITDVKGHQVFTTKLAVDKGQKKILLIDYTILNPGTYYFSIIGNEFIETKKVIVQ
jgi:hypothetical protein